MFPMGSTNEKDTGRSYSVRSIFGGGVAALLATTCCLPWAVAIAFGASAGTIASMGRLREYQVIFQVVGGLAALFWVWYLLRRSRASCAVAENERNRGRVPMLALGGFAVFYVVLNQVVVRWLGSV